MQREELRSELVRFREFLDKDYNLFVTKELIVERFLSQRDGTEKDEGNPEWCGYKELCIDRFCIVGHPIHVECKFDNRDKVCQCDGIQDIHAMTGICRKCNKEVTC